ncbi:hypothetical protein [Nonomuraea sp. SBT364]|uniref:hypothetical protein n=1 Tax=Nonomuraea sp. SBT364 TaxID=1580530 RepID=UPI00066E5CE5|nr:hypothetical protein [Nonomuraea sp. SBT364]
MADESTTGTDPFTAALQGAGSSVLDPRTNDPKFVMEHSRVRTLGRDVGSYGDDLTSMSDKTRAIDIETMSFGLIGGGLNVAHRSVRDGAAEALKQGKEVLESWRTALGTVADNTEAAEEASKAPKPKGKDFELPGGGAGGLGPMGGAGDLGDLGSGVDPGDLDGLDGLDPNDVDGLDPNDIDGLDPNDVDGLDPNDIDGLDPNDVDGLDPNDIDGPDPNDLDGVQQPDPNIPRQPDLSGVNQPDLDGLNQPSGTDLAGVDPRLPTTGMPNLADTPDPRSSMPRASVGYPEGVSSGGSSAGGALAGGQGSIARALNSGMPLYPPPMGGGGAPSRDEQDREKGPLLAEDEGVWGDDEDIAPAVLGMEI